ncbi:MAG: PAS domain-containing protein, partial [Flavobacteriales bacterium]|nr:PAS domain-containing protein [Flavobacteriales bacterium]MDW8410884.1 PAS domain-containing protein [Flavobacteriales bacterium]
MDTKAWQTYSHSNKQNLAYILTDTDFNIVGVQALHKKGVDLLGGEQLYGGEHISAIDIVRYFLRDVGWENLAKEVGKKCLSLVQPFKNFPSIELQIIPLQSNSGIKGYLFNIIQRSEEKPHLSSGIQSPEIPTGLKSILDNSQDIIFLKDKDLRYVYVNKSFCRLYNLKPEDVLGKTDFEILPLNLAEKYFQMDLELLEGKSSALSGETVFNNRIIDYKKFIIKTENDEEYIAVVAKDVTYWRQLIENLESKQRDFEYFFNNNLFGAFFMMMDKPVVWNDKVNKEEVLDYIFQHQKVTRVNQVFAEQYGAKPEEMIGYKLQDFFGDDVEQARRVWREFLDNKGRLKTFTKEKHKSGKNIIIEGDYVGIYDEQGRFLGHFGVQMDVTEKLEQQQKMEEYKNLLEESFRVANMGGWESDLETGTIRWTKNLYKILELKETFIPTEEN